MSDSTPPLSAATTVCTDFAAKEDWEKWMNFDGQQQFDVSTPGTHLSGSPPPLQFVSGSLGSTSPSELESLPPLNFSPTYALPTTAGKKRKSAAINGTTSSGRQPRGQKISHNVIEKRYRSNLNDKIARLRDSVPELRAAQPTIKRRPQKIIDSNSDGSGDEGQGLKFNKATVLVKATEYIQQLERQNQRLQQEVSSLRHRSGSGKPLAPTVITTGFTTATYITPQPPSLQINGKAAETTNETDRAGMIKVPADIQRLRDEAQPQESYAPESSKSSNDTFTPIKIPPFSEIQGMIPLPEAWKKFRAQTRTEEHYAPQPGMEHVPEFLEPVLDDEEDDEGSRWSKSRVMSRILVGSLAGLMLMEGFNEAADEDHKIERRGLFSLPTELVTESRGFRDPIRRRIIAFAASPRARQLFPMAIFSFLFLAVCFAGLVYLAPAESRAVRQHAKDKDGDEQSNATSVTNSIGVSVPVDNVELTPSEEYTLKILNWLNLSWLVFDIHDEEAAESHRPKKSERWTRFLLPRAVDSIHSP